MDPSLQATADQLTQARAQSDPARLADALLRHANALAVAGQLAPASLALDEALQLQRQRGARDDVLRCLLLSAELLRLQGRRAEAGERAREGLAMTAAGTVDHAQAQAVVGEIALSDGDAAGAEQAFDVALAIARDAPAWWRSRARARAASGRFEEAATDLETAHDRWLVLHDDAAGPLEEASLARESARLRKRFQTIKEKLHAAAKREGLVGRRSDPE